jgi:excisionase family DNA binding protein
MNLDINSEENSSESFFDNLVWMTSQEAATYLRKSVGALRTAVCRGQIRSRKWRRRLYFKRSELDRLLETS